MYEETEEKKETGENEETKAPKENKKPVALITGVSRKIGIGAAIARSLAGAGWDIALSYWRPYDNIMPWGNKPEEIDHLIHELRSLGAEVFSAEADLSDADTAAGLVGRVCEQTGSLSALILSHCHSVDSTIETTSVESFDLHFAVNARATWLLIREFSRQFSGRYGSGRIISITSDHVVGNLPYGASKGAMDRIVIASAEENRDRGITSNVINPGATDTGWMDPRLKTSIKEATFLSRLGQPEDCARLVEFLCSEKGKWINGQILFSNGGVKY